MSKSEFLTALREKLSTLPQSEVEKSLGFYAELIDDRMEEGMSEEEAVAGMEDPALIAERIMYELPLSTLVKSKAKAKARENAKMPGAIKALLIILLVLALPVWLPIIVTVVVALGAVFAAIWAVIVALFAAVLGVALLGLMAVGTGIGLLFANPLSGLLYCGGGLLCLGLGILAFFLVKLCAKGLSRLIKAMWRGIKSLFIKEGRRHEEKY